MAFELKIDQTHRGFDKMTFIDRYNDECSIQKSSIASEECIWFGLEEIKPKILAKDAVALGLLVDDDPIGWVEVKVPKEMLMSSRMHLTQEMAAALIVVLQKFVDTGEIV